ncbi:T9SS type B sorting domain-containing protein [Leeuwenhoekiella sp. A16]|uniref:T9SS type B sorting domain-containing protein n=1 Tax=Leeuwenhoekiella sp. A16 TaxID=3141462 RepID=UPI003A7FFC98
MKKTLLLFLFLSLHYVNAQVILNHNVGNTLVDSGMPSCEYYNESWSRVFNLSDFGIELGDQFLIRSGQVGISKSYKGAYLEFSIFSIDSNFPDSRPQLLGVQEYIMVPAIEDTPQIIQKEFSKPIVVPAGVERILVTIGKVVDHYNPNSAAVIIAATAKDNDISWYEGCRKYYNYTPTTELDIPVPNANFYINVTGDIINHSNFGSQATLTHNGLCDKVIETSQYSCTGGGLKFGRTFILEDFGITKNEEYTIKSGQVAFSRTGVSDVKIQFNIYKIDADFPISLSDADLIGSSQIVDLPYVGTGTFPRIFNVEFENPITIPSNVDRILVEVYNLARPGYSSMAWIAGSEQSKDLSWIKSEASGCPPFQEYKTTIDLGGPDINYYINVTGNVKHTSNTFTINISNICSEFLKEFSIDDESNVASILWNFGDIDSGALNQTTDLSPFHDFSKDGRYTITATVTSKNGNVEVLTETIDVKEPPTAYGINDVYACETNAGSGISTTFDVHTIEQQVLGGQTDKVVSYIDGSGKKYNVLPNPFTNTIKDRETIRVRVAHENNSCCYSETSFDLLVNHLPQINTIPDLQICDDDAGGIAVFDISNLKSDLIDTQPNLQLSLFFQNGEQIPSPLPSTISNKIPDQEVLTARVTNTITMCSSESTFRLIVNELPVANNLVDLIGCDDNQDGISEYFDTSQIETQVLSGQTGMAVTYYDEGGKTLANPLPNPYTNTTANIETLTVRVTNTQTGCYAETPLNLITSVKPQINQPKTRFACDAGNGYSTFDLGDIEEELIGNQSGLTIYYFDEKGTTLASPLPANFQNTSAWSQRIRVRVENISNPLCFSETNLDLFINELPELDIAANFVICDNEPGLQISRSEKFDSWQWEDPQGTIISTSSEAYLSIEGTYTLTVGKLENGILCTNSNTFEFKRSEPPSIQQIDFADCSDNNYIAIQASGDGDFEYSIDGVNFQNSELFPFISGGVYNVTVRDKEGCGQDSQEVVLVDYKKVFTPNGDGYNDYWQVEGIEAYPDAKIYIFDRYAKLLKQITTQSAGWDGTFNTTQMPSDDYWFHIDLGNGRVYKNHFTLKR